MVVETIYGLVRKTLGSYNQPGAPMYANFILSACVAKKGAILELKNLEKA